MSNNGKDDCQSSASNTINLSIVNGKITSTALENQNIPDKSPSNISDRHNQTTQIENHSDDLKAMEVSTSKLYPWTLI